MLVTKENVERIVTNIVTNLIPRVDMVKCHELPYRGTKKMENTPAMNTQCIHTSCSLVWAQIHKPSWYCDNYKSMLMYGSYDHLSTADIKSLC